jgi:superfamily I DNA and RNA helicase
LDATVIRTLDLAQEKAAKQMGGGHRILSGVAGSGKTLILTARAKWLAENKPESKILITCFNVTLAAYIRSVVTQAVPFGQVAPGNGRIEARHFHDWARSISGSLPRYGDELSDEDVDELIADKVIKALQNNPTLRYDAILVDEAHILHPSWFKALREALTDPDNGTMLIVNDASQKLKRRKRFSWSSVGIKAQGRSRKLAKNYRNTKEVLTTAWQLLSQLSDQDQDADETFPVVTPEVSERSGALPRLFIVKQVDQLASIALESAQADLGNGLADKDIAFLYRYGTGKSAHRIESLQRLAPSVLGKVRLNWVTRNQASKQNYGIDQPGVRLLTTQSALGLEFKSIYLLWAEDFDNALQSLDPEVQLQHLRELYVALTRAQDQLTILGAARSPLVARLEASAEELGLELIHA